LQIKVERINYKENNHYDWRG